MEKLALLYEYQQIDAKLEAFEKKLKNTATRKQLIKLQDYLKAQQVLLKDMETKAMVDQNSLSEIDVQHEMMTKMLGKKHKDIGEYEKVAPEELDFNVVKALVQEYESTYENIVKQKRKAVAVAKSASETETKLKDILSHVNKVQQDFAQLKTKHENELKEGSGELDKLRKEAEAVAKKVDKDLLGRYMSIKQNRPMPVALLSVGRCMGCNMDLPSSAMAKIKSSGAIVECENCGRILYMK